jgi:hypothetical protein
VSAGRDFPIIGGPHVTPALPDLTLPKAKSGRTVRGHDKSGTAPRRGGTNLKVGFELIRKRPDAPVN